jgi:peptidoglycan-binding protein ArfA
VANSLQTKFNRRPPGLGWLLALLLVPLLLGAIGYATLDKSKKETNPPSVNASPTLSVPSVTAPNATAPGVSFAPLSITRNGNDITLSGDLPDGAAKASLLDGVKKALRPGVNVVDTA